jgi:Zn-finger nucleic acid-binding protein
MQPQLQCPKCRAPMEQVQVERTQVDRCTKCRGLWFDALEDQDIRGTEAGERLDTAPVEARPGTADSRSIDCPRCQTRMIHMVDRMGKRIQYESCPRCHGKFLDAGEFRATEPRSMKDAVRKFLKGRQRKS